MPIDFLISHTGSDININAAAAALLAIVRDVIYNVVHLLWDIESALVSNSCKFYLMLISFSIFNAQFIFRAGLLHNSQVHICI